MAMDPDGESSSAQELVESVVKALVQHYGDPVHEQDPEMDDDDEGPDTSSADSQRQEEFDDDDAVPPVLAFQLRRLLKFGTSDDDSTPCGRSSTAAARPRAGVLDVWAHLVQSYATTIRPTIFVAVGNGVSPKLSVVEHYQRLTRLYLKNHEEALLRAALPPSPEREDRRGGIPAPTTPPEDEPSLDRRVDVFLVAWERAACDVTLATALEVRRHRHRRRRGRRRHKGKRRTPVRRKPSDTRGTSASEDGTDDPVLLGGGSDSDDDDDDAENDDDEGAVDPTATIRICAALVRHATTMGRGAMARRRAPTPGPTATAVAAAPVVRNGDPAPNHWDRVALRCAIAVLPFQWEPRSLLGVESGPANPEAPRWASSSADPLHSLPMTLAPKERDDFRNLSTAASMDWSLMLQLKGSVWDSSRNGGDGGAPADLQAAVREFGRQSEGFEERMSSVPPAAEESSAMDEVWMLRRWSAESLSKAVRAHFFGRDMLAEPAEEVVVPTHRTRLHLGTTVRYEPDPDVTQKPHLLVPSRVVVALHWMSVLRAEQLTESVWNELLPILYELLSASSYALNGWGAVALYRLVSLHDHTCDSFLVSEQSETCLQNLLLMLHTIAKTCREGPVLAVTGKAYCKVLGLLGMRQATSAAQQRRAASEHWLTVLYQNQTRASAQPALILGLLTGVIQILNDQVTCASVNNADGLEVGRLGLSALLPLLVLYEEDAYAALESARDSSTGLAHGAIRLAALVGLNNLMIAAYPVVPRHAGKILSHLLRTCADTQPATNDRSGDGGEQESVDPRGTTAPLSIPINVLHQGVALHVASTAAVLSRDKGNDFLVSLENDQDSYCDRFREVIDAVRTGSQKFQPPMAPVDQRTSSATQRSYQVL